MEFHEHFELAQDSRSRQLDAEFSDDGIRVKKILNNRCEFDQSKYMRIFGESFPDQLEGIQLEALSKVCLEANHSEEINFLIDINARNQWLRTIIGHEDLQPTKWTEANKELLSAIVIHSIIVPYDPYWPKPRARRGGTNDTRVHFPSCILKEALDEKKALATKLREWMCSEKECEIGMHKREQLKTSKWFWEIQEDEVNPVKELAKDVWLVTWNGGRFVRKETSDIAEFEVVQRFSHPHIVYSVGELCGGTESPAYFMEYMSNELKSFIVDRKRLVGNNKPPFLPHDSVDILLQIAKAMEYMHGEDVNVVHCDLKSMNVLISTIAVSETVKHYLVKVADFGSARSGNSSSGSTGFIAGRGTTPYMAPEALQQQQQVREGLKDTTAYINFPHKIDVYSFGIIAFEVLTGDTKYFHQRSPSTFKKGVIGGTTRPPLHEECKRARDFMQDEELILLIESCWHSDPLKRPSFLKICEELTKARDCLSEAIPSRISLVDRFFRRFSWY